MPYYPLERAGSVSNSHLIFTEADNLTMDQIKYQELNGMQTFCDEQSQLKDDIVQFQQTQIQMSESAQPDCIQKTCDDDHNDDVTVDPA